MGVDTEPKKDKHKKQRFGPAKIKSHDPKKHLSSHLLFTTTAQSDKDDSKIDSLYADGKTGPGVPTNDTNVQYPNIDKVAFISHGFREEIEKSAVNKKILGGLLAAFGGGLAVKGGLGQLDAYIKRPARKELLDMIGSDKDMSEKDVHNMAKTMGIKRKVRVAKSPSDLEVASREGGKYGRVMSKLIAAATRKIYDSGANAAYIPPKGDGDHVLILSPKTSPGVVAHELGHAKDMENLGGSRAMKKRYRTTLLDRLSLPISKRPLEKRLLKRETEAWKNVPEKLRDSRAEEMALKSYQSSIDMQHGAAQVAAGASLASIGAGLYLGKKNLSSGIKKGLASIIIPMKKGRLL